MDGFHETAGTGRARWSVLEGLPLLCLCFTASAAAMDLDPVLVGKWPRFGGDAVKVVAAGRTIYTTVSETGLVIFDAGDPAANPLDPRPLGVYEATPASGLAVDGKRAYVQIGGRLVVIDVSDPASPRELGSLDGVAVFVSGSHAYALSGGLTVVDVRDPAAPRPVGSFDTPRAPTDVFVASGRAYAVWGRDLWVIDVEDPSRPRLLGTTFAGRDFEVTGGSVFVSEDHAWIAADDSLLVIDVRDPANPRPVSTYSTSSNGAHDVFVAGDRAFITGGFGHHRGFHVIDVQNPALPRLAARYATFGAPRGIAVSGSLAYVAAGDLEIVDLSVPPSPERLTGTYETTLTVADVAVSGGRAYVADERASLHILDVADPAAPRRLGRHENARSVERSPESGHAHRVFVEGELAYVLDHAPHATTVLEAIDAGDPRRPQAVGWYDAGFAAEHSLVAGGHAYLARTDLDARGSLETRLRVIDLRDPAAAREVGAYATGGGPSHGLCVFEGYAYLGVESDYESARWAWPSWAA